MINIDITKSLYGAQGFMDLSIKLEIQQGEFVALMGESGAGKTTLLRILAGLESYQGEVHVEGISWKSLAIQKRKIGFVFQDYALFEHMSVEENLLFVHNDTQLASELLEMTALSRLKERNVRGLSGGQKQRVALCRAMMKKPKLLLMDEPLSALDTKMKKRLQQDIKALHERFAMTTLMVSHDREDVYALSSRVIVLSHGHVVHDTPSQTLISASNTFRTSVLELRLDKEKKIALVSLFGNLFEIQVSDNIMIGDEIDLSLSS